MYIFASCFISQIHLCRIFEDRFVSEEGAYREYVTDDETDIYQKDKQYDKIKCKYK